MKSKSNDMENKIKVNASLMTSLLKTEEAAQLALCILALYNQPIQMAWWLWPLVFLAPDFSMVGYLINTRVGAFCYNLFHHKAIAGSVIGIGFFFQMPLWLFIGLVLWAHSSFDRMLGYGLKYEDSFQQTHLGFVGKEK